jgi:hypothetical protein
MINLLTKEILMSNIIPANFTVPAHLAKRVGTPSALAQSLSGGIGGSSESYPRLSIKGSRFRIVEGGNETVLDSTTLDVVIVGANPRLSKTWYAKTWTPEAEPSSPDCFSIDGIKPNPDSTNPQNDLCVSCPQNAWGSKVTAQGKEIKACSDQKRLAVVSADDPSGDVYLLQVTPAALSALGKYQKELSVRGIPPEIVRTKISFDTDASFPKLMFSFGGFIDEETQEAIDHLFGSDKVKEITGESTDAVAPVKALAQVAPKPVVKVVAHEPAVVEPAPVITAEPEPAPAKRGFGAPKKPVAKQAEPKAQPTMDIADEIAALIGGLDADDE